MNYRELKKFCDEKIKEFPQYESMYKKEIIMAKRYYDNDRNLYEELKEKEVKNKYVIPFLLGITNEVEEEKHQMIQARPGASGGVDVDVDLAPTAKEKVTEYLRNKFGDDRVISVGTSSRLGPSSAAKDLMRIYKVDFKESNKFTSKLEKNESWESNLERIKETEPSVYKIYEKHKEILDLVPYFIDKVRQCLPYYQKIDLINNCKKQIADLDSSIDYISYMDKNGKKQYTKNYKVFESGKKKIFEITTVNGKKIRASVKHKFFMKSGEIKELKDLKEGDEIIVS